MHRGKNIRNNENALDIRLSGGREKNIPYSRNCLGKFRPPFYISAIGLPNDALFMQNLDDHADEGLYLLYETILIRCFGQR